MRLPVALLVALAGLAVAVSATGCGSGGGSEASTSPGTRLEQLQGQLARVAPALPVEKALSQVQPAALNAQTERCKASSSDPTTRTVCLIRYLDDAVQKIKRVTAIAEGRIAQMPLSHCKLRIQLFLSLSNQVAGRAHAAAEGLGSPSGFGNTLTALLNEAAHAGKLDQEAATACK